MAVTDEAISRIKGMIISGELRPGDRLPKEAILAEQLGLSRSSLREAVKALSMINILDVRQGDGTYVTSLEPDVLLEAVAFILDFHQDSTVLQTFQVRGILEPAATALAAQHITDADLAVLEALLEDSHGADLDRLVANDLEFHRVIAAAARLPLLSSLLETITASTVRARIWRGLTQTEAGTRTHAEHREILQALRRRDAETARAWSTVHIASVTDWLRHAL